MEDLMSKVLPVLEWIRNIFMKIAELIARFIQTEPMNIYNILLIVFSIWLSNKIVGNNYTTLQGRYGYLITFAAIIFGILKFLGAN